MHAILLLSLLAISSVRADDVLTQACKAFTSVGKVCDVNIKYPVSAKVKECKNKWVKTDPCKTKAKYKYPCPTWKKPGRMCDGWTCMPGTTETWIDTPCGLTIETKELKICDRLVSDNVVDFIDRAEATCDCLKPAVKMIEDGAFDQLSTGEISQGTSTALTSASQAVQCIIDKAFRVEDNRAQVVNGALALTDGWRIIPAEEITLATYTDLAARVTVCAMSGQCESIPTFFLDYFKRSQTLIGDKLKEVFLPSLEKLKQLQQVAKNLEKTLDGVSWQKTKNDVKRLLDDLCKGEEKCSKVVFGQFWTEFQNTYTILEQASKAWKSVDGLIEQSKVISKALDKAMDAIDSSDTSVKDLIIELVKKGKLAKINAITELLSEIKKFPKLTEDISAFTKSVKEIPDISKHIENLKTITTNLLNTQWLTQPSIVQSPNSNAAKIIQSIAFLLQTDLRGAVLNFESGVRDIRSYITNLPFKNGKLSIASGVASYQRWTEVSFDYPCSTTGNKCFELAGYKECMNYPKFYRCNYAKRIPLPNHHIPFLKIRFE
ncbi:hypothetical protein BKA69DRAFT_1036945 [Paraphysoderma sedebokerense]|nr:hypothetical protein BKA69DRAFT_1036945 [Paraphysoderma sedebokerense]